MTGLTNVLACIVMLLCGSVAGASSVHVVREPEQADPISGLHWQRVADPKNPAAPPRLTLRRGSDQPSETGKQFPRRPVVCVRAGDHVLLRGTNAGFSMMSLEATAVENGTCGARVRARVAITGALVEMTVLDAGAGILSGKARPWR
jgi:hypothetical protein